MRGRKARPAARRQVEVGLGSRRSSFNPVPHQVAGADEQGLVHGQRAHAARVQPAGRERHARLEAPQAHRAVRAACAPRSRARLLPASEALRCGPRPARKPNTFQSTQAHSAEPGQCNMMVVCQGAQRSPAPIVPTRAPEAPCCVTEVYARPPQSPGRPETGQGQKGDGRARARARRGGRARLWRAGRGRAAGPGSARRRGARTGSPGARARRTRPACAPCARSAPARCRRPPAGTPAPPSAARRTRSTPARACERVGSPSAAGQQARTRRVSAAR